VRGSSTLWSSSAEGVRGGLRGAGKWVIAALKGGVKGGLRGSGAGGVMGYVRPTPPSRLLCSAPPSSRDGAHTVQEVTRNDAVGTWCWLLGPRFWREGASCTLCSLSEVKRVMHCPRVSFLEGQDSYFRLKADVAL